MNNIDYVKLYAEKMSDDNRLFAQQKILIESQLRGSSSLFKRMFKGDFKTEARKYLKGRGLI